MDGAWDVNCQAGSAGGMGARGLEKFRKRVVFRLTCHPDLHRWALRLQPAAFG